MKFMRWDLINAGEEFYAEMKRSTNGGGENSPMLEGEDDFYEMFFASLERGLSSKRAVFWEKLFSTGRDGTKKTDGGINVAIDMKEAIAEAARILLLEKKGQKTDGKGYRARNVISPRQTFYYHFEGIPEVVSGGLWKKTQSGSWSNVLAREDEESALKYLLDCGPSGCVPTWK